LKTKPCPECGRQPTFTKWWPVVDKSIVLYALQCMQPDHICHGSYRRTKDDATIDWNLSMARKICKSKPEGGESKLQDGKQKHQVLRQY
jgi:hypothetical protein